MSPRFVLLASLALLALPSLSSAQPAPIVCGPGAVAVFEPGCDGPGRLVCDRGSTLPAASEWCACDGRTIRVASLGAPAGARYRFAGACEAAARFELTDERSADGARTGRVVVFVAVDRTSSEVARVEGPCREVGPRGTELARLRCGPRGVSALVIRRDGDAVVTARGARELSRTTVPPAQRVVPGAARRLGAG